MCAVTLASASRRTFAQNGSGRRSIPLTPAEVPRFVTDRLPGGSMLQIGGDATIGKGLCAVRINAAEKQVPLEVRQ
jgi:hypothetical protein